MTEQWKELKETIIEMRDNDGTGTQQETCNFLANYMDILEKQMQEPNTGHWIPVSERLPEIRFNLNSRTSDTVFVCLENSTMHMAFYCDDDVWRFCESGEAKEPMWDKVIAWMPLPQLYKAESEEYHGNSTK